MVLPYTFLFLAIVLEVVGTLFLRDTAGFTKMIPNLVVVFSYAASFYFLSLVLKYLPIGITYAIWSGAGIILLNLLGYLIFNQKIDMIGLIGIALIISGVILIQGFSSTVNL